MLFTSWQSLAKFSLIVILTRREQYATWRRERKEQEEEFARVQTQEYGKGNQEEQEQETNKDTEVSRIKGNQEEQEQETNKDI